MWIPASHIPGSGSSCLEEAGRALSCTSRRPDPIQAQPLQQSPELAEPCGATTEDSQVPSDNGCQQSSLVFEFVFQNIVRSFWSMQPVQCGNISQMLKGNISTGKVRPKWSRVQGIIEIMVFVVQGPGTFPMLHSRASLTHSLEAALSNLKI